MPRPPIAALPNDFVNRVLSQLPVSFWHEYLNDPTVADALLDRLLNGAHRIELKGESMRKKTAPLTKAEAKK